MQSPLRYPGGKSNFVTTISQIVKQSNLTELPFFEPYAGGAAISLALLKAELVKSVTILEKDPLIYCFWKSVFENTEELVSEFEKLPITLETWHDFQQFLKLSELDASKVVELGLAGLFFNRANFSGILNGGPIGGKQQKSSYNIDCRTNKTDLIKRIREISTFSKKVNVVYGDAIDLIVKHSKKTNALFYIDPPYFTKGESLYRHYYKLGDHKRLAEALKKAKFPWILSYDVHHVIEFLYEDFFVYKHSFNYSVGRAKKDDEFLISNFELPKNFTQHKPA